jgi:hypothetical protein
MRGKIIVTLILAATLFVMVSCEREVTETIVVTENTDCFTCHNDQDFGDEVVAAKVQWDASVHATGGNFERDGTSCSQCHTNEGFKAFLTTGETINPENPSPIGCFTCHAPHTEGDFSLRTSIPVDFVAGGTFDLGAANLCANCHQARAHSPMAGRVPMPLMWTVTTRHRLTAAFPMAASNVTWRKLMAPRLAAMSSA